MIDFLGITLFGTELKLITFVFVVFEVLILSFQTINYLARRKDKSRQRFLILIILFVFYNLLSGFLPTEDLKLSMYIQNLLAYLSGAMLASFFFYYLVLELNIYKKKLYNVKLLLISIAGSFVLSFGFFYVITKDIELSKRLFSVLASVIALVFYYKTIQILLNVSKETHFKKETPYKKTLILGLIGFLFMVTMPIVVVFGNYQIINHLFVNISFLFVCYAYINKYFYESNIENLQLSKIDRSTNAIDQFGLTSREVEIASLILKNMTYNEIGEDLFITPKTVSKHASNIFKKTNCNSKIEFIESVSITAKLKTKK